MTNAPPLEGFPFAECDFVHVPSCRTVEVHRRTVGGHERARPVGLRGVLHPVRGVVDVLHLNDGQLDALLGGPTLNHRLAFLRGPRVVRFPTGLSRTDGNHHFVTLCVLYSGLNQTGVAEVERLKTSQDDAAWHGFTQSTNRRPRR